MSNPTAVSAQGLVKTYALGRKHVPVLHGAALDVRVGEAVAIVGRSGAGKSTLLHVLGGIDRPTAGTVHLEDVDLYAQSRARRSRLRSTSIGFVFQSYYLLSEMDVLENVMLPAMATPGNMARRGAIRARARELLDAVGLADRHDHTPLELSGGEQQRVAIARAFMNDPALVLADEPTGNLDDSTGGQVLDLLFGLTRDRGHTLVMVTHSETTAQRCDRVLRLQGGRLV